jgi:heme/copper-type cytochrome/quinol oxidase subunit 3
MQQPCFFLWFLGIPFGCLTLMYIVLTVTNWKTSGEIKNILPPDVLLKVFAVFMVVSVIFVLAVLKIIQEATVSALLGAVVTGVLGISYLKSRSDKDG